jgi:hypothetical protein
VLKEEERKAREEEDRKKGKSGFDQAYVHIDVDSEDE